MANKFKASIPDKIIGQYQSSPIMIGFIEALASEADILSNEIHNVIDNRYLSVATGIQLDILGDILGISREVVDFVEDVFFGFFEDPTSKSFGDLNDPFLGGRFASADEDPSVSRKLNDTEYRALLFAKISENSSDITSNEVLRITRKVLDVFVVGGSNIPVLINETKSDITNGGFSTSDGWTFGTDWTVGNGEARRSGAASSSFLSTFLNTLEVGASAIVTVTVSEMNVGSINVGIGTSFKESINGVGEFTFTITSVSSVLLQIGASSDFDGAISSVHVNLVGQTQGAAFEIEIQAVLDGSDQAFISDLGIIPRPAGVRISYKYIAPSDDLLSSGGLTLFAQDNTPLQVQ